MVLLFLVLLRFKIDAFAVWLEVPENQEAFLTLWKLRSGLGADELAALQVPYLSPLLRLY
jgi:hypothetical protein